MLHFNSFRRTSSFLLATVCVSTSAAGQSIDAARVSADARPANPGDDSQSKGEIVVTALKRSTNLQNTPLAISAVAGSTLAKMGISDSTALSKISPGLVIRESGQSGVRLTIRNIEAAGEATVGLYYDETPITGSSGANADAGGTLPNIRLFDVDHVEVLRGPQGTLYGSSSMAGTVRIIFAKPKLDLVEAAADGQVVSVSHGGLGFQDQAMVNVPLIRDKLAIRAVGFYDDAPGYIDNVRYGQKEINSQTSYGGRMTLRAEPIEGLKIDGLAVIQNLNGSLNDYSQSLGHYQTDYESLEPLTDRLRLYSATSTLNVGPVTLTADASHSIRYLNYTFDFSAFLRAVGSLFPVGSANYNAYNSLAPAAANSPQVTKTDTAEIRASSRGSGALQWTAGFFYSKRDADSTSQFVRVHSATGIPLANYVLAISDDRLIGQRVIFDDLKQIAGFGEVTYTINRLSLTGGIRYFRYTRGVAGVVTKPNPLVNFISGPATDQTSSENGFLYKANASYKLADHFMAYATASSGERPGGINQTVGLPSYLQSYMSDKLWNYELGLKSQFMDKKLTVNADIFQINWNVMQTSGSLPNTTFAFITNAGSARVRGVEIESTVLPFSGLQIRGSGSCINAILLENQANQNLIASGLKGNSIPFVPKITGQGSIDYDWTLFAMLKANVHVDVAYNG